MVFQKKKYLVNVVKKVDFEKSTCIIGIPDARDDCDIVHKVHHLWMFVKDTNNEAFCCFSFKFRGSFFNPSRSFWFVP